MNDQEIIRSYYDENTLVEWERLCPNGRARPEFALSCRMLEQYIKPGDRVLDLGGGPGRYSLHLAQMGVEVTLADLSSGNIAFAKEEAKRRGLRIEALVINALDLSALAGREFDHVLCMGPLYHLLEEEQRQLCVRNCLSVLKPGGLLFACVINGFAGVNFMLKDAPEIVLTDIPAELDYRLAVLEGRGFAGDAFTRACFLWSWEVEALMARFPLEKLHLVGCEGILSPNERTLMEQPDDIYQALLDFSWQLKERPELLCYSEHLMYVGRKALL